MSTPAQVVEEQFSQSRSTAAAYITQATAFTGAFTNALFPAALVDVTFAPVAAPSAVAIPAAPVFPVAPTWDIGAAPADLSLAAPDITIDAFTDVAPVLVFPDAPVLDFGVKPVLDFGVRPTVDAIAVIAIPDAPIISAVALPSLLTLSTPAFSGIDLHSAYLTNLETIPTLQLAAPTPYSYSPGAEYASTLLTNLKAALVSRLAGGTGLAPADEAAIWDRARSRETQLGIANEADVTRTHEALGFMLPTGVLAAQLRAAQQDSSTKISTLSRDIAIKQADLAQENMKTAISDGMQLEAKLIDQSQQMEQRAFETARYVAENAVQVHNALVEKFKSTVLGAYQLYAAAYDTIIKGELAKVEVFRAEIAAEQAKADANRTLIEQYRAQIEAGLSLVKIFEAQVGGAKARMELEQAKLAAKGEEIRAYVAGISGETARLEAYKIGAEAEGTRAQVYKIGVDAQVSRLDAHKVAAQVYQAKAGAQGEKARVNLGYYNAQAQVHSDNVRAFEARAHAEGARFQAISATSSVLLDSYKAQAQTVLATADQDIKRWDVQIREYEALQTYTFNATKANNDVVQARSQMVLDASKAGAQIFAQLASSAMSTAHVSAGVSASAGMSVGYSYSNDTTSAVAPITAI
jgi:hypothetical protein